MDTIFALASAQGKAGVAVIRLSGPDSHSAAARLTGGALPKRGMVLRTLTDHGGARLDDGLVLTFQAPASFTGEDVAELQIHGSTASVNAVLRCLSDTEGLRIAEPGEFTRRALENGKMDLTQVEGLADLIDAETEAQRKQAQTILAGELGTLAERWRRDLIRAASLLEAVIDFADEEVPTDVTPEVRELIQGVMSDLHREADGVKIAERIRTGFEVAIVGLPNAGKSTLLNALAGREAAITSEYAGTTRDVIEVRMDLAGLPVTLLDTAGLRETEDHVENLGIELARSRAEAADLRVFLSETPKDLGVEMREDDIHVLPKADLRGIGEKGVSGKSGQGIDALVDQISCVLRQRTTTHGIATRERHRIAITRALDSLTSAISVLESGPDLYDIAAEELRTAIRALESLVGRIDVETLLDEIFSSFCLGK
ncbi:MULTISPECIES: tRNA uridine-5-carboxymethylaminomethyl(34) synthesis GTPase MnmE [unclassified Ruegeria]|uniref:tRNA uridine-5-carboxymethylaminomethyl(34) synthesis GTPase MnmE n=1 Tax=unclassified Ruegeria TaxID=2625375 RepID=UPI00149167BF|nr:MULTISPECIES: tRNA uridine-5-carboxymethylaminomethyl(34) synthesis GTPase MnmE [unclassified Ruegeria]NOC45779.1 tRNA uridine-5-carboxymethylaminomethyl(34) synthesis GTPase MnmE [Ruegeria sp. HKCCD7559]